MPERSAVMTTIPKTVQPWPRDELARATERAERRPLLDDDHGRDHGPDRQQVEPRDDQQE